MRTRLPFETTGEFVVLAQLRLVKLFDIPLRLRHLLIESAKKFRTGPLVNILKPMSLIIPDDWHDSVNRMQQIHSTTPLRAVVIGPKNVGKSTFVRFVTDKLLKSDQQAVFTLETDCGQPDNTPPGIISLTRRRLLPNSDFVDNEIISQRFLGFTNPASNPFTYIRTIEQVVSDHSFLHQQHPLIVNCHGYGTSVGKETWEAIITSIQPEVVIYIGCPKFEVREDHAFLSNPVPVRTIIEWITLSKVIVLGEDKKHTDPNQTTSSDYRWIKFAQHFRPDLISRNVYKSCHPKDFFIFPFTRLLEIIQPSKLQLTFPCFDEPPSDPLRAIEGTIVALIGAGQVVSLAYVARTSSDQISLIIPPNVLLNRIQTVDTIARGEMNWSPRDKVAYNGKSTSTDYITSDEPYFLTKVLGGDGTGAKLPRARADLKRRRLSKS